jgi:hypothetical protein
MIALGHSVPDPRLDLVFDEASRTTGLGPELDWFGKSPFAGHAHDVFGVEADTRGDLLFRE